MQEEKSNPRLLQALAIILLGLILVLGRPHNDTDIASFAAEPVKVEGFNSHTDQEELIPQRIIIPDLGIDLEVAESKIVGGYWEVFDDKAGWGEGSSLPGEVGNQVIFAHAREGLFGNLKDISEGTNIYVFNQMKWYQYVVQSIEEVYPSNTKVVEQTDDEHLTLYTCSGYQDQKRLIIVSKPI